MSTTTAEPLQVRAVLDAVGGTRGVLDGGLPPLVFAVVNATGTASDSGGDALHWAITAALATGGAIVVLRRARHEPIKQALGGLAGLGLAASFAAISGQARDFFLPGMLVDAAYALAFAVSVLIGRPVVGSVYALLSRRALSWRQEDGLRRVFAIATLGWALVFAVRAGVQIALYSNDYPGLLAVSKLTLGWPLTVVAVVLTLAYVRRAVVHTLTTQTRVHGGHLELSEPPAGDVTLPIRRNNLRAHAPFDVSGGLAVIPPPTATPSGTAVAASRPSST